MLNVEADGPVLRLTLARPEVRNALDGSLIAQLSHEFMNLPATVRVVVLAGKGTAFCAGADLEWMRQGAEAGEEENYQDATNAAKLFNAVARCPAAVISKINGSCFGGGCGLVAASDVAIACSDAKFAFSEVRLGLVPATIGPIVMNKIGRGHARAMFVTGEVFDAKKAYEIGLVHQVCEPGEVDRAVEAKIKNVLSVGPNAIAVAKLMAQNPELTSDESARLLASVRSGKEAREGIDAFLHKRKPSFAVEI